VVVVGCSGSGKTTLARRLAATLGSPHIELDSIYHQAGWTPLDDANFRARVQEATEPARWVVDGNYSVVQDIV
jgi:adenylate kinase family enzyme